MRAIPVGIAAANDDRERLAVIECSGRDRGDVDIERGEVFGVVYDSPIFTCPTSGEKSLHPDGELAIARATKARGTMQMLSTSTSTAVEDVNAEHGRPVWFQLLFVRLFKFELIDEMSTVVIRT